MNTILIVAVLGVWPQTPDGKPGSEAPDPFSISNQEWIVESEILIPVIVSVEYTRTAPSNYTIATPTKRVAAWCPSVPTWRHGYSCGMSKAVEDLLNHLQTEHDVSLEQANQLGRSKWEDYHDDLHWCDETLETQDKYLHPTATATKKAGCVGGNCSTETYTYGRRVGFF